MELLPLDIWRLILDVMATEGDLVGLLRIAQTSRTSAYFALPLLYEHDSNTGTALVSGSFVTKSMWWRSVIMSTLDRQTYQPYYAFLKILDLGRLTICLGQIDKERHGTKLQDLFFDHPLRALEIRSGKTLDRLAIINQVVRMLTNRLLRNLDFSPAQTSDTELEDSFSGLPLQAPKTRRDKILDCCTLVAQVANMIAKRRQKKGAARHDIANLTASKERCPPTVHFPTRTVQLTNLTTYSRFVLTDDLALAIRKACPRFKKLYIPLFPNISVRRY